MTRVPAGACWSDCEHPASAMLPTLTSEQSTSRRDRNMGVNTLLIVNVESVLWLIARYAR